MAYKYCDHGAYRTPTTGGTAPPDGYAEDGDGTGMGKATSASVVLTISDYTQWVAGTDSLSIAGQSVTIAAPTTNADMATKIAAAINAATGTGVNAAVNPATTQLRNLVNAVASGVVLTLYTRTGGEAWNSMTCTTTKAAAFSTSFPATFSGATGGCWGYVFNSAILWASAVAIAAYGVVVAVPFAGSLAAGDCCYIRPNNNSLSWVGAASQKLRLKVNAGTQADPIVFSVSGAPWSESGKKMTWTTNAAAQVDSTAGFGVLKCDSYGESNKALTITNAGTSTLGICNPVAGSGNAALLMENVALTASSTGKVFFCVITGTGILSFKNGYLKPPDSNYIVSSDFLATPGIPFVKIEVIGGTIECPTGQLAGTGLVTDMSIGISNPMLVIAFIGPKFKNYPVGTKLLPAAIAAMAGGKAVYLYANDCDMGGVNDFGGVLFASQENEVVSSFDVVSNRGDMALFKTTGASKLYWAPNQGLPVLSALTPLGNKWSVMLEINPSANANCGPVTPINFPRMPFNNPSGSDGVRTVSAEILTDNRVTPTDADIWMEVEYVGADGNLYRETTRADWDTTPAALSAGSSSWSSLSYSSLTYVAKRLSLTTENSMKAGCPASVDVFVGNKWGAFSTMRVILDPQPGVA